MITVEMSNTLHELFSNITLNQWCNIPFLSVSIDEMSIKLWHPQNVIYQCNPLILHNWIIINIQNGIHGYW